MAFHVPSRRILVIKTRAIGDTVLLTGVLRVLRKNKPNYKIDVLVRSQGAELLEGIPFIDRVIAVNEPKSPYERFAFWTRLVRRLRERRYELVLNFHASIRTAGFAQWLRAGKVITNHHDLKGRNWFSDVDVPGRGQVKAIIDRDLDILRAMGIHAEARDALPEIHVYEHERTWAAEKLKDVPKTGPVIFLGIGGSRETKRWAPEHFAELANRVAKETDAQFILATIPSDKDWMQALWTHVDKYPGLRARMHEITDITLRQVAAILTQCALYIGNDSGVKHIAIAVKLPTFTFFGPELPTEWHPYDTEMHPYGFITVLECRTQAGKHWCSVTSCTKYEHQCMKKQTPEIVYDKIRRLLNGVVR